MRSTQIYLLFITVTLIILLKSFTNMSLHTTYLDDSEIKYIQSKSVLLSHYTSEAIYHPFLFVDPDYKLFINRNMLVQTKKGLVSQYSIFFAYLSSPIIAITDKLLIPIQVLLGFITILVVSKISKFSLESTILFTLATPVLLFGYEYSENTLHNFLGFVGFALLHQNQSRWRLFFSGFLIGLTLYFRIEILIYFPLFGVVFLYFHIKEQNNSLLKFVFAYSPFLIGFFVVLQFFLVFNYVEYGSLLGPRFMQNAKTVGSFSQKVLQLIVLWFYGFHKVGFFGFTPIFMLSLGYFLFGVYKKIPMATDIKINAYALLFFLILMPLALPTEGNINWGPRYLAFAIFPAMYLTDRLLIPKIRWRFQNLYLYIFLFTTSISLFFNYKGYLIQKGVSHMLKDVQKIFLSYEPKIYLFQNEFLARNVGDLYFSRVVALAEDENALDLFLKGIQENAKLQNQEILFFDQILTEESVHELRFFSPKIISKFLYSITPHTGELTTYNQGSIDLYRKKIFSLFEIVSKQDLGQFQVFVLRQKK
jgi:hypothetical protein